MYIKSLILSSKIDIGFSHIFLAVVVGIGVLLLFLSILGCCPPDGLAVTLSENNKVII